MTTQIRNVTLDDMDALHRINQAVSSNPNKTPEQWQLAYYKYVDYYPTCEPENSFVITDDQDEPFGYILCSANFKDFLAGMTEHFKELMNELEPDSFDAFVASQEFLDKFQEQYPAHLHIDILPTYQNVHAGSRLMAHLLDHLKKNHVPGLCLGVSATRPQAIHFYKKNGFEVLSEDIFGYIMGIKLD